MKKLPKGFSKYYVTRAAFAKMQGEKQRLQRDIRIMVMGNIAEAVLVKEKYRKEYKFWEDIKSELREIAKRDLPSIRERLAAKNEPKK